MKWRFNAPPGWPGRPPDWVPPPDWTPDPAWPPAPPGWRFWVPVDPPATTPASPPPTPRPAPQPPAPWLPQRLVEIAAYLIVGAVGAAVVGGCAVVVSLID